MTTTQRSRRGHLTKDALRSGLREQRAWLTVGMERHEVELFHSTKPFLWSKRQQEAWVVYHRAFNPDGTIRLSWYDSYQQLTDARLAFKQIGPRP